MTISFKGRMESCIMCIIGQGACYGTGATCTQSVLRIVLLSRESEDVVSFGACFGEWKDNPH